MTLVSLLYRLVWKVAREIKWDMCFEAKATECLQEASGAYLVIHFEDMNLSVIHTKWVTITPKAVKLARKIREEDLKFCVYNSWICKINWYHIQTAGFSSDEMYLLHIEHVDLTSCCMYVSQYFVIFLQMHKEIGIELPTMMFQFL